MATNYDNVNAAWPDNAPVPSGQEALAGARKLVRLALTLGPSPKEGSPEWYALKHDKSGTVRRRKKFRGDFKLTSGVRRTWTNGGTFYINPNNTRHRNFGGWKGIVHDISHWAGRRLYPDYNPHDHRHAFIERTLAEHVVKNGWLDGKLKRPEKAVMPVDRVAVRAARIDARIKSWERKFARAENALKKLRRQKRYYDRCQD